MTADGCRHPLDERCPLCVSDQEFETAMAGDLAARLAELRGPALEAA